MPGNRLRSFTKKIFILLNVLAALFFLAGCYNSFFDPTTFWFVGLFTLASFYLLIILVFFILFWLFAKPRLMFISLVAIGLAWVPMRHLVKLRMSPTFAMQKNNAALRVMSWNVEHFDILEHKTHPETKVQMIELINQYQPDVACFQEMVGSDSMPDAINSVPDIAQKIGLPHTFYSYNRKLDFDGRHHFGIITFSKYPIVNQHTISYAPNDYNSIFQYVDIVKDADTFRVFNIHLQSLRFSNSNLKYIQETPIDEGKNIKESLSLVAKFKIGFLNRRTQSEHVKKALNESPYPVIVCGDFNDVPNSYAYTTIGKGLKNAFTEKGTGIGRTFYSISPTLRIDNIFTDPRFSIEQFTRVRKKLSDHFPLIADVFYNK